MSYDDKLKSARLIVENHNKNADKEDEVKFEDFLKQLRKSGGTSEDGLKQCSWEMLEKMGLPVLIARQVAEVFRKVDGSATSVSGSNYISEKKVQMLGDIELLQRLDLADPDSVVAKRLHSISKGRKFIVLNDDGTIDITISAKLLKELRDNSERELYVEEGKSPRQTYAIGDRPNAYANKNPLYEGHLLRPDNTCGQTHRDWTTVPLNVRQIVYLATRKTGEITINSLNDANNIIDIIISTDGFAKIQSRCPKAVVLLKELNDTNSAPTLKVPLAKKNVGDKRNDPFLGHKNF